MTSKREQIEAMLQERPDEVFLHYSLAMEHLSETEKAADETAALTSLERTLELEPAYVPALQQLGMLHSRMDNAAAAREVLDTGIAAAQAKGDAHAVSEMQAVLDSLPD